MRTAVRFCIGLVALTSFSTMTAAQASPRHAAAAGTSIALIFASSAVAEDKLPAEVVDDPIDYIQGEWVNSSKKSNARIVVKGRTIHVVEADQELRTGMLLDGDVYFQIESWKPTSGGVRFHGVCWSRGKKSDGSLSDPSPYRMCEDWSLGMGGPVKGRYYPSFRGWLREADKEAGRGVVSF